MNRRVLLAAALTAMAFVLGLSLDGGRRPGGVVAFEPKGFLAKQSAASVRDVELESNDRRRSFHRGSDGEWQSTSRELSRLLDDAVALTRNAAPERNLSAAEIAGIRLAEYGLDPPSLVVSVHGPGKEAFRIALGGVNPLGLSRYAKVEGHEGVWLVPGHLARAWEDVMSGP